MKVVTKRDRLAELLAERVAAARKEGLGNVPRYPFGSEKKRTWGQIIADLKGLDLATCDYAEFDRLWDDVTNRRWSPTAWTCDECDEDREALMHFGDEPDYDMRWQYLCRDCLLKAAEMVAP